MHQNQDDQSNCVGRLEELTRQIKLKDIKKLEIIIELGDTFWDKMIGQKIKFERKNRSKDLLQPFECYQNYQWYFKKETLAKDKK